MPPAASGFILMWSVSSRAFSSEVDPGSRQENASKQDSGARMEAGIANELEQPILGRPSRDTDVEAMRAIYRGHIRDGVGEGVAVAGTPQPDELRDRRRDL